MGKLSQAVEALQESVRPLVTLLFGAVLSYGWLHDKLSDDAFIGVASIVIGFWFRQRAEEKQAAAATAAVTAAVLAEKKNGEIAPATIVPPIK